MSQESMTNPRTKNPARHKIHVFLQSLLAAGFIFIAFLISELLGYGAVAASVGASAMIAFVFPEARSSRPRHIIGGYISSAVCGCAAYIGLVFAEKALSLPFHPRILFCALAVFLAVLCMVTLDFIHPPAAALAIIVVLASNPLIPSAQAVAFATLLCLIKRCLKGRIINL